MTTERTAALRILADENMPDPDVLAVATGENRLLATQDKDFGDIVVNRNRPAPYGVVLFRLHNDIADTDRFRLMAGILNARNSWGPGIWAVSIRHPTTS